MEKYLYPASAIKLTATTYASVLDILYLADVTYIYMCCTSVFRTPLNICVRDFLRK